MICRAYGGIPALVFVALLICSSGLSGCAALMVAKTATSVTAAAVKTTARATGAAVGIAAKAVTGSQDKDKNTDMEKAEADKDG